MPKLLARRVSAAIIVGAILSASPQLPALAEPVPVQTVVGDRTSPAVQAVYTEYTAKATLGNTTLNDAAWKLAYRGVAMVKAGELTGIRGVAEWMFERIRANPTRYFRVVGKTRTISLSQTYVGSAFIASASGYAVTARHVVTPDAEVGKGFSDDATAELAKSDGDSVIWLLREWDLSSKTKRDIRASVAAFDQAKLKLTVSEPKVSVLLGVAGPGGSRVGEALPAEVVDRSGTDLGEDVAVLRIRTSTNNLPALKLASEVPGQGSEIYVNCFTADATWNQDMSEAAQLQPTMAGGRITAIKPANGGIDLIQTDAVVNKGCSGGAAFNADGEVIGIVVSGVASGQNYVQPAGVISDALGRSGADLKPSLTSELWSQALADYYREYFSKALAEFEEVQALYAPHAYVGKFIADSQTAITQGRDKTPPPEPDISPVMIGIGVGSVVLLLAGGVLVLVLIRRRARQVVQPGDSQPSGEPDWPADDAPVDRDALTPDGPWVDEPPYDSTRSEPGAPRTVSSEVNAEDPATQEPDEDTPDTFPSWRPIDFVPAYPPADSEPKTARG